MRRASQAVRFPFLICLVLCLPLLATTCTRAQLIPEPPFTLKAVGPNAWAAIENRKAHAPSGANAGFVIGEDSVAIIDTFASKEAARQLLAEVRKLTQLPVRFVINTHHHPDHVSGNGIFVDAGAVVLGQRNVREWIHSETLRGMTIAAAAGNDIAPEEWAAVQAFAPPTVVYDDALDVYLGSREIQIRSLPGHTGGDSVVLIPDAKIAFAGDLFWRNTVPNTIDASTKPWIDTLNILAKDRAGSDGPAVAEAVMARLKQQYGEWDFFTYNARQNILDMDAESRGTKRIPAARRPK